MDVQSLYTVSLLPGDEQRFGDDAPQRIITQLTDFILEFQLEGSYIYRYEFLSSHLYAATNSSTEIRSAKMFS